MQLTSRRTTGPAWSRLGPAGAGRRLTRVVSRRIDFHEFGAALAGHAEVPRSSLLLRLVCGEPEDSFDFGYGGRVLVGAVARGDDEFTFGLREMAAPVGDEAVAAL